MHYKLEVWINYSAMLMSHDYTHRETEVIIIIPSNLRKFFSVTNMFSPSGAS